MRLLWLSGLVLVMVVSLLLGSVLVNPFKAGGLSFLVELRLPRVLAASVNGAMLGLSGALYQMTLRNPLADGFTTGAASSCALGAVVAISLGFPALFVGVFALATGLLGLFLVYVLSMRSEVVEPVTMVLAGIVVNIISSSAISLLKFVFEESVLSVVFWLMGSITLLGWGKIAIMYAVFFSVYLLVLKDAYSINLISMDGVSALATGVDVAHMRRRLFFLATSLVAFSVSFCGVIAFVGLMVPHIVRRFAGSDASGLIFYSSVGGALLLVAADTASRTLLLGGAELPVGVITSLLGGAFFLYLLFSNREAWYA